MILVCPSCGATHSAEAWENDMNARKAFAARAALPIEVSAHLLPYLALFRPDKRALSWSRSLKVMQELAALIAPGWVQVQGKPARECPPAIWAAGMAQMVERSATLQRPLKNHNYLRQVVWQLADQADAGRERTQHHEVVSGEQRARRQRGDDEDPFLKAYKEKHGALPGVPAEVAESLAALKRRLGSPGE